MILNVEKESQKIDKFNKRKKYLFAIGNFFILRKSYHLLKYFPTINYYLNNFFSAPILSIFTKRAKQWVYENLSNSINIKTIQKNMDDQEDFASLNNSIKTRNDQFISSKPSYLNSQFKTQGKIINKIEEKFKNFRFEYLPMYNINIDSWIKKDSKKSFALIESKLIYENSRNELRNYIDDSILNLKESHQKSEYQPLPTIRKDKLSTNKIENSDLKKLNDIQEISVQNLEKIKLEIINLIQNQSEITPEIYKSIQNLKAYLSLPTEINENQNINKGNFVLPNFDDIYKQIMNKLTDLDASPNIVKSLSNIFYIDVRELKLSDSNSELHAFEEIIKMNSLFRNIIINQYDFKRYFFEGRTRNLKEEIQIEIFNKIAQQEGFIKFIFGLFN